MMPEQEKQNTALEVAQMVHAEMKQNGGDQTEAFAAVVESLAPKSPANVRRVWLDGFGHHAVSHAYWIMRRMYRDQFDDAPPAMQGAGKPNLPDNWGTRHGRWATHAAAKNPLDMLVAIPGLRGYKRYGDMTGEDWAR